MRQVAGDGQTQKKKIASRARATLSATLSLNSFVIKQSTCAHVPRYYVLVVRAHRAREPTVVTLLRLIGLPSQYCLGKQGRHLLLIRLCLLHSTSTSSSTA